MIAAAAVDLVVQTLAGMWAPPAAPPELVDFVTQFRWTEGITVRDGEGARIDPRTHAAHYHALKQIGEALLGRSRYRHLVFWKCTQDGGTWITVSMPLIYCTTQLRQPAVAGFPDMRLAGIAWRQKMRAPILKARRGAWLPSEGPGSDGNSTPVEVALCDVPLYFIGGGASNEAGQASLTGMLLTRDERDAMDPDVAALMTGRLDGFDARAVIIDTSTNKADLEAESQIAQEMKASTACRLAYPCPACGGYQFLSWDHVRFDATSPVSAMGTAHLECAYEDCKAAISDAARVRMLHLDRARLVGRGQVLNRDGTVTGELPETLSWGLTWSALDSPIKSLAKLVSEYWDAAEKAKVGNHADLRKFYRDRLCSMYTGDARSSQSLDATALALRSAKAAYAKGELPAEAKWITVAGDVQKRELWWLAIAFDDLGRWWIIDYGRELVTGDFRDEPSEDDVHRALDRVAVIVAKGWMSEEGAVMHPTYRGWDSRYQTAIVKDWLAAQGGAWVALRGAGDGQLSDRPNGKRLERIEGAVDVREISDGTVVYYAEASVLKDVMSDAFRREPGAPGAGHLPRGEAADGWLIKQLVAERKIDGVWVKKSRDNHFGDCAVYDLALGRLAATTPAPEAQIPAWSRRTR